MTVSVLNIHFCKLPSKVIRYRCFKKFENERFMDSLYLALNSQNIDYAKNPGLFFNICQNEWNHHVPKKGISVDIKKIFMTKTLSKFIMESMFLEKYFRETEQIID